MSKEVSVAVIAALGSIAAALITTMSKQSSPPPAHTQPVQTAVQPAAAPTPPPPSLADQLPGSYSLASVNGQPTMGEMVLRRIDNETLTFTSRVPGALGTLQYGGEIRRQGGVWYVQIQSTNDPTVYTGAVANDITMTGNTLRFQSANYVFIWTKR